MEEATRKKLVRDYAADLEAYHGIRQASYTIIPAPLLVGNFGPRRSRPDGRFDIYGILGAVGTSDGVPQFGSVENLRGLVWHEFGHSFVNPEVERLSAWAGEEQEADGPDRRQDAGERLPTVADGGDRTCGPRGCGAVGLPRTRRGCRRAGAGEREGVFLCVCGGAGRAAQGIRAASRPLPHIPRLRAATDRGIRRVGGARSARRVLRNSFHRHHQQRARRQVDLTLFPAGSPTRRRSRRSPTT
jgi:hypothetical protein